ncbi:MAG: M15 family metallopeptidase [Clostridia bacterium]|nr:M15 family metallopeptidase [Clostridia bacterium]
MAKRIYEHNFTLPLVVALVVLGILLGVYFGMDGQKQPPAETTTRAPESTAEPQKEEPMPPVSFKADLSAYEDAMTARSEDYLLLVNKHTPLSASHKPTELTKVKDARKDIELEATAARALEAMFIEMRAEGFSDVFVTSAYRSYDYQVWLFNYYIGEEKAADPTLSDAEARERVLHYSAAPGTSEHQSGLCVDLMTSGMRELDESFADYPVFDWLTENAWKFGFILRFPKDKVDITLYDYEPWHYRFVGRDAAYEIWSQGLCLEEYLAK